MDKKKALPVIYWCIGMILCPLGVALSAKGGFGVSMIEAPVYIIYLKLSEVLPWFTFGMAEYLMQAIVLLLMCVIIRRFRWRYLLSFLTAILFGFILDGWRLVVGSDICNEMWLRILCAVIGIIVTAFAVAFFFRTWMPQEVWELFVKEVTERYNLKMTRVKWIYDISTLCVGILLMLLFFHSIIWSAIGIGTIVTTLINAPIIGFCGKIIDRVFGK